MMPWLRQPRCHPSAISNVVRPSAASLSICHRLPCQPNRPSATITMLNVAMCFSASCGTMKGNDSSLLSVWYGGGGRTDDCAELSSGGWTVRLMANDDDTTMAQRHGCGCCGGWTMVALAGWTMTTQLMGAAIDGQQRCRMDDDGATDADGWSGTEHSHPGGEF